VCVVAISGELDIATAAEAAVLAAPAVALPAQRLVLDLSGLRFIDGRGARMLAELTAAADPGTAVIVRSAGRQVRQVLHLLGVDLERRGSIPGGRSEWLLLEIRAVRGWAEDTRADSARTRVASQQLRARSRQLRTLSRAFRGQCRAAAQDRVP
jgi:anti-anti-sigma factor